MRPDRVLLKEGSFVHLPRSQPTVHLLLFSDLLAEVEEHRASSVGVKFVRRQHDHIALLPKDVELSIKNVIHLGDPSSRITVTDQTSKNKYGFKVETECCQQATGQTTTTTTKIAAWAKSEAEKAEWIKLITQQITKIQSQREH